VVYDESLTTNSEIEKGPGNRAPGLFIDTLSNKLPHYTSETSSTDGPRGIAPGIRIFVYIKCA